MSKIEDNIDNVVSPVLVKSYQDEFEQSLYYHKQVILFVLCMLIFPSR